MAYLSLGILVARSCSQSKAASDGILFCVHSRYVCVCVCVLCVCLYVAHTYLHTCTSCMYHSYQLRGLSLEECIQRQAVSIADETFR